MTATFDDLAAELRRTALTFELEPLDGGRVAVLSPFTFDDGDRYPLVIEQTGHRWRLSDEGGGAMHLSYADVAFDDDVGNRARLIAAVALRHGLSVEDWELARDLSRPPRAADVLDFLHALARVNDVEFLGREIVASTFADDVRSFFGERVDPQALRFDHVLAEHDPAGRYRIDVAIERVARPPLFVFAPGTDAKVRDATITLLTVQGWGVRHDSVAVFEDQQEVGRAPFGEVERCRGQAVRHPARERGKDHPLPRRQRRAAGRGTSQRRLVPCRAPPAGSVAGVSRVLVAMSGGVDSSMAAALLVEAGHEVAGVHLKMADTPSGLPGKGCCTLEDARDARRVADLLGIPFYVWDLSTAFRERVIDDFVAEYAAGRTPNPCIRCNERVKYAALLRRAVALGYDALATGHHVRLRRDPHTGRLRLLRAADPGKDQTYVLASATQEQLAHTQWPVGEHRKSDLRAMAAERGLVTAAKPDSHDVCFIPTGDLGAFLRPHLGARPGRFVDPRGTAVGTHDGAYRFTVGQRRGLGLAGHEPRFVTAIEGDNVHVGPRSALACAALEADGVSWVAGSPPEAGRPLAAQVRYRGAALSATVTELGGGRVRVSFDSEQPDGVAPGQAVVLYDGDECLGGATIIHAHAGAAAPARRV